MTAKPRFVQVTGVELDYLFTHSSDLGVPSVHAFNDGPPYLADADELRAWRSQHTSQSEQT